MSEAIERVAPELWWEHRTFTDLQLSDARRAAVLRDEQKRFSDAVAQAQEEAAELRTLIDHEREQARSELGTARSELGSARGELEDARGELTVSAARYGEAQAALAELEGRFQRQGAILEKAQSSMSWRITAPL